MERFNKVLFDQKKVGDHYDFTLEDGTVVNQIESPPEYYVEKTSNPKSNFSTYKEFYFSNGNLKTGGRQFYAFPVGVWKEYSEKGELVSETNEDKPFHFSIDDLNETMKKKKIDIMKPALGLSVSRSTEPSPAYTVAFPLVPGDLSAFKIFVFDGTTGKLINETVSKKTW